MTPHEERLVLELHAKWGNRWSRIARKLPGRTDNEIKNYWRTHTRKKAQDERKRSASCVPSSYSSSNSPSSLTSNDPTMDSMPTTETEEQMRFYDTGGIEMLAAAAASPWGKINYDHHQQNDDQEKGSYSMDGLWEDIDMFQMKTFWDQYGYYGETVASPIWNYCPLPRDKDIQLWTMEAADEESKMSFPDQVFASYE